MMFAAIRPTVTLAIFQKMTDHDGIENTVEISCIKFPKRL
jgi:hypothetical protein